MKHNTSTAPPDEADLVLALKSGDQAAFAELVDRHSATVYNLALRMMGDQHEAEEVLQETFISAFRAVDRFQGRSQLGTWLYRIAYNAALMRLRKRRLPTTSIDEPLQNDEGEEAPRQVVDWRGRPDDLALTGELRDVLDAAVATLPATLRSVFVLRDIEGLSTAEVADVLGLTETNVKVRLHRARLALRERLSSYFATDASRHSLGSGSRRGIYVSAV
jgi:RNA polymerase sigma-70 factor (ECF subfamily)